jgi:hypothetical protein
MMDTIPDELAAAVRQEAAQYPPYPGNLAAVLDRHRRRTRHRAAGAALAAVAAGLVVALIVVLPHVALVHRPQPGVTAETPPTQQRLLLDGNGWSVTFVGGPKIGISASAGVVELLPDGTLVTHPVSGVDSVSSVVAGPGGGIAVLGPVQGTDVRLVLLGPAGAVQYSGTVSTANREIISLLAVTRKDAYLQRNSHIVRHDLHTGAEQPVLDLPDTLRGTGSHGIDLGGAQLAVVDDGGQQGTVRLWVQDVTSGAVVHTLAAPSSAPLLDAWVKLSTDGRRLAVTWRTANPDGQHEQRIAIYDLASGRILLDQNVFSYSIRDRSPQDAFGSPTVAGVVWLDPDTVRVAWTQLPPNPDRLYSLNDVLKSTSFRSS